MGYRHIDVITHQSPKRPSHACGDVVQSKRTVEHTLLVCGDGLGSGVRASVAAHLNVSRLMTLMQLSYSMREAFATVVRSMNAAREPGRPFTAFSLGRFLPNGETTVLSYESPPPVLVTAHAATPLRRRDFEYQGAALSEAHCALRPGEGILLVSDGITQAGLGAGLPEGWGVEGLCRFVGDYVRARRCITELPRAVHQEARQYWGRHAGDDCTVSLALCREGRVVTLFTGPPRSKQDDSAAATEYLGMDGAKVICGATTAQVVARILGKRLDVSQESLNSIAPPYYRLEGIDLVTEGAVTLNQVYNILEEDTARYEPNSGVSQLGRLLKEADRVNFLVGRAPSMAAGDIAFRQQGILPRLTIVPLLERKLRSLGKLVVTRYA